MGKFRSYKDLSREGWGTAESDEKLKLDPSLRDKIRTGALDRIADAAEVMAQNFNDLQEERDKYKKWYYEIIERNRELWSSNYHLRGHITRLKKILRNYYELTGSKLKS